ncbi:hypothetical protein ACWCXH_37455 [Kitasatospora sp. NPDC001660]
MSRCQSAPQVRRGGAAAIDADGLVTLHYDTDQPIDPAALHGVLDQPKTAVASGVTIRGDESFDGVCLRLTATDPATCRIAADRAAIDNGLFKPAIPNRSPALAEGNSLAYLTLTHCEIEGSIRFELGATGHGPAGQHLADRMCDQIRLWDKARDARSTITLHPAGTPDNQTSGGYVIDKPGARLVITY